eukprot:363810-Chlamydomonas_euryale.AAC.6
MRGDGQRGVGQVDGSQGAPEPACILEPSSCVGSNDAPWRRCGRYQRALHVAFCAGGTSVPCTLCFVRAVRTRPARCILCGRYECALNVAFCAGGTSVH